jgi:signal transduction histidine kinase/CheY-like chemotaxis protein
MSLNANPLRGDIADRLARAQVNSMAANGVPGAISGFSGAALLCFVLVRFFAAAIPVTAAWLAVMAACYAVHLVLCSLWRRPGAPRPPAAWLLYFAAIGAAEGAVWGAGIIHFCATLSLQAELFTLLLGAGVAGAVGLSFGSSIPAFLARFLPATQPYIIWALAVPPGQRGLHAMLAATVGAFTIANLQLARGFNASFIAVQTAGFRNSDLAEQLRLQAEQLRMQKEAAEAATLSRSRFLAAASHDLRQPVHALSLFVGALRGTTLPPDKQALLTSIEDGVIAIDGLFAALLDLSRLDAATVQPHIQDFAVRPLLTAIMRDHANDATERGLRLSVRAGETFVRTDRVLLERMLRNLIGNAVRYTEAGGVLAAARRRGPLISIEIYDTGPGIPAGEQARIFDEFHQLRAEGGTRGPGLGLGLAIVQRLSQLLNIPVRLRSVPGRGSCFALGAPAAEAASIVAPAAPAAPAGGRIWIVENHAATRESLAAVLRAEGYEVRAAASAEDVLSWPEPAPDLVVSDHHLGAGLTGLDLIERLAGPALLVTARTEPELTARAAGLGVAVLHKPVPARKLSEAVMSALRKADSPSF